MIKCKICKNEFKVINGSHLKKHDMTMKEYREKFPDAELFSEETRKKQSREIKRSYDEGRQKKARMTGNDNPMRRPDVTKKHKKSVRKKERPEWRRKQSESLKGRKVGGALKPRKLSKKISALWDDPNSIYNTKEYAKKMEQRKKRCFQWTNTIGQKFASELEKDFSEFLIKKDIDYEIRKVINLDESYEKQWVIPDFYLPDRNLIIEVLGSYGTKLWNKEIDDIKKRNIYEDLGYDYLSVYPEDFGDLDKIIPESKKHMTITNIFDTICGEGIEFGRPAIFIRSTGCNLRCKGCDTPYAYENGEEMSLRDILFEVKKKQMFLKGKYKAGKTNLVFLTGGEITMHKEITDLILMLKRHNFEIILQTNGTNYVEKAFELSDFVSADIKTPCFEEESDTDVLKKIAQNFSPKLQLKFVVKDADDVIYAYKKLKKLNVKKVKSIVFQPYNPEMSRDLETSRYKNLVESFLEISHLFNQYNNVRLLPRLQILLWENKKGV